LSSRCSGQGHSLPGDAGVEGVTIMRDESITC
jgi:hypothetical protein